MSDLVRLEGIRKSFGPTEVLRGVSFGVGAGEIVGLFGSNGSGKTTLANIISGLVAPDSGKIRFGGRDVTRLPMDARFRAGIARTFQIPDPYPSLNVLESVQVALLSGTSDSPKERRSPERMEEKAETILLRTGLFPQRFWPAAGLSQGCLRRLEFARAISCGPRFVILDEVFSGLSARDASELASLLRSLHRDDGVSFLLISHNPLILEEMCCRVVAIEDGRVAWEGNPADLSRYVPSASAHAHGHDAAPGGTPPAEDAE